LLKDTVTFGVLVVSGVVLLVALCLVGVCLLVHVRLRRHPSLQVRLARAEGEVATGAVGSLVGQVPEPLHALSERIITGYDERLRPRRTRERGGRLFDDRAGRGSLGTFTVFPTFRGNDHHVQSESD
jgi:hypothetical protein